MVRGASQGIRAAWAGSALRWSGEPAVAGIDQYLISNGAATRLARGRSSAAYGRRVCWNRRYRQRHRKATAEGVSSVSTIRWRPRVGLVVFSVRFCALTGPEISLHQARLVALLGRPLSRDPVASRLLQARLAAAA